MSEEIKFTSQELNIIRLLLKSYSLKMIAGEFNVSIETIRSHMKHIHTKLGAHSILQVINWAHRSGLFNENDM
jgi:DNA-binding NarL/FixJ family response regulator